MSNYNLDDKANQSEYFEFTLGGNVYHMQYPTTEEIDEIMKLSDEEQSTKLQEFITPVDPKAPSVKDALANKRVPVLRAFSRMLKQELNIGEE